MCRKHKRQCLFDVYTVDLSKYIAISALLAKNGFQEVLEFEAFLYFRISRPVPEKGAFLVLHDLERSDAQRTVLVFIHKFIAQFNRHGIGLRIER